MDKQLEKELRKSYIEYLPQAKSKDIWQQNHSLSPKLTTVKTIVERNATACIHKQNEILITINI